MHLSNAYSQDLQEIDPMLYARSITVGELSEHLHILASDEFEGRETAKKGQQMAAKYIADEFISYGLPRIGDDSSYYQTIPLIEESWDEVLISINDKEFKFLEDYYCFARTSNDIEIETSDLIFLGYGIENKNYNDYVGNKVKGKVLVIFHNEPMKDGISYATGYEGRSAWSQDRTKKSELAITKGAKAVIHVVTDINKKIKRFKHRITKKSMRLNTSDANEYGSNFFVSMEMAEALMANAKMTAAKAKKKINKKGKPISFPLQSTIKIKATKRTREVSSENLLGYIEGTDLKDEILILTAHYDHIGMNEEEIYNGADDDGSGTVALLEIAQAFQQAKAAGHGPRRSVLIMPVTGEEKGLLGSRYYSMNPIFPLEMTVANLNVDMIGRVDEAHEGKPYYVYIIGSDMISTDLHNINEDANARFTNLDLDYKYNSLSDPNRFYDRSDHYNFAKNGIPVIFYFNGTHEDYHKPTDTVDKIHFDKLQKTAQLIFCTAWIIANRNDRPVRDKWVE